VRLLSLLHICFSKATHRATQDDDARPHGCVQASHTTLLLSATAAGQQRAAAQRRPFVLAPPGVIGQQRFAATHAGLVPSDTRHFRWSVPAALRLGMLVVVVVVIVIVIVVVVVVVVV
jgi:alpha-glucosidase (family GH31 glycosyl hydrolase)